MFIKMIDLHELSHCLQHFLRSVSLAGSFSVMRECIAIHIFFAFVWSAASIFFKGIIHLAIIGKSTAIADIDQRKSAFHQKSFCIEISGIS